MADRIELALHEDDAVGLRSETLDNGAVRVFVTAATTVSQLNEFLASVHPELSDEGRALWADDTFPREFIPEDGFIAIRRADAGPRL